MMFPLMLLKLIFCLLVEGGFNNKVNTVARFLGTGQVQSGEFESPGRKFKITFEHQAAPDRGAMLTQSILLATSLLENAISFQLPISIRIHHHYYCTGQHTCLVGTSALAATATSHYVSRGASSTSIIPTALLKSTVPETYKRLAGLNPVDITLNLKDSHDFYYPHDYDRKIQANQVDVVSLLIHEISHGLGITTYFSYRLVAGLVNPAFFHSGSAGQFVFGLSSYERLLYEEETGQPISRRIDAMNRDAIMKQPSAADLQAWIPHSSVYNHLRELTRLLTTPNAIYIRTKGGRKIYVETSLPIFFAGSSVCHVSIKNPPQLDDSILAYTHRHTNLTNLLLNTRHWKTAPLSEATVDLMATLGYKLKSKPLARKSILALVRDIIQSK